MLDANFEKSKCSSSPHLYPKHLNPDSKQTLAFCKFVLFCQDKLYTKLVPYLLWALPVGVRNLPIYFKIFNYLEYDVWKMFDQERRDL